MTLVVRGGTVVTRSGTGPADIVVDRHGRIADLVAPGTADTSTASTIDAGGLLVLPGMIDAHVHFQEPGRADWEGFDTGSAAAAAGGVTTVIDMPIDCDPPTVTAASVLAKAAAARRHSRVDVGIWGGLVPGSVDELEAMARAGVVGFKAFACPSGWADFPEVDEATLSTGMATAARLGVPVAVHCELAHLGHSVESEVAAVSWAASLAAAVDAHLHVVHISAAPAVDEARRWPRVTVETCPHYLFLDDSVAHAIGATAHCFPPIRDRANARALWSRLARGAIDAVASDHSPCPPSARAGTDPWAGIDGIGLALPLLLSDGRLTVADVARLITAAARYLRLPGKGAIATGFDADLAFVDPTSRWQVGPDTLWTRHRLSPYVGRWITGQVVRTMVRGRVVFSCDDGPCEAGGARVVTPSVRARSEDQRRPGGRRRSC